MGTRTILLAALVALVPLGLMGDDDTLKLPGSGLKVEDAWLKSDVVFKGEITGAGSPDVTCSAASVGPVSNHVKVTIFQIFRGNAYKQISTTMGSNTMSREVMPEVGGTYIFFVIKTESKDVSFSDPFSVLKVLAATDANIALVKKLISN